MLAIYGAPYSISHYVRTLINFREAGKKFSLEDNKNNAMISSHLTNYFHAHHLIRSFEATREEQDK